MFRRRREQAPPARPVGELDPAWRARLADMAASRDRFASLAAQAPPGALRDRLVALQPEIGATVELAAAIAQRAQTATVVAEALDVEAATAALKEARRRLAQLRDHERADLDALEAEVERRAAHHAAVHRALNAVDDADERVAALDVRLRTAVAEAAALVLRPVDGGDLDRLDGELRDVHASLAALSDAFAELER